MTKSLDDIMSSERGEAAPDAAPNMPEPNKVEAKPDPAPQLASPDPVSAEQVMQQPQMVPLAAVREARKETQEARERVIAIEAEMRALRQMLVPKPEPKPVPDMFVDPNGFVQHHLDPIEQRFRQMTETMSRRFAVSQHGQEAVQAAYATMGQAIQAGDPDAVRQYRGIMESDDPYGDLVRWHKNFSVRQKMGDDPEAYIQNEAKRLAAEMLAQMQAQQSAPVAAAAPVLPTNLATARNAGPRTGVTYSGPKPLSEIMSAKR